MKLFVLMLLTLASPVICLCQPQVTLLSPSGPPMQTLVVDPAHPSQLITYSYSPVGAKLSFSFCGSSIWPSTSCDPPTPTSCTPNPNYTPINPTMLATGVDNWTPTVSQPFGKVLVQANTRIAVGCEGSQQFFNITNSKAALTCGSSSPPQSQCTSLTVGSDTPMCTMCPFAGFADPTIRRDMNGTTLWLAYSDLLYETNAGARCSAPSSRPPYCTTLSVTHLAQSSDGGVTWTPGLSGSSYLLWDGANGDHTYTSHEVPSLWSDGTNWESVRVDYPVAEGATPGNFESQLIGGLGTLVISQASTPAGLAMPSAQVSSLTVPNLNQMIAPAPACSFWNEPIIIVQNGTPYLFGQCVYSGNTAASRYYIFSATTGATWTWHKYSVAFGGSTSVGQIDSSSPAHFITEMDLAQRGDGSLVAIVELADPPTGSRPQEFHYGCYAADFSFNATSNAFSAYLAEITDPSSTTNGPGACAYDPSSRTGILLTHKVQSQTSFNTSLEQTGFVP